MPPSKSSSVQARTLFGLPLLAASFGEAIELLSAAIPSGAGRARVVVTPNVDHLVRLERDLDFKSRYAQADFLFADGMPIVWASRWLGKPLPERVTGADLFVALCEQAARNAWKVIILGGRPGTEQDLHQRFMARYPALQLSIISPSMGFDPVGAEAQDAARRIAQQAPDLVFVCLGFPKQEIWAMQHAHTVGQGVMLCVGAAMEFALGLQKRAPLWMRKMGLEWLWRLLSNPGYLWRRYLVDDPYFLVLCIREWRQARRERHG